MVRIERSSPLGLSLALALACAFLAALGLPRGARAAQPEEERGPPAESVDWQVGRTAEVFGSGAERFATRFGGWLDGSYENSDRSNGRSHVNLNHLDLFLDTRYGDRWQLFAEVGYQNESELLGFENDRRYEVNQLFGRYRWSDDLELRVGRFNTPFGYWTPIDRAILMDSVRAPLHVEQGVTPEQQRGFSLGGNWYPSVAASRMADIRYTAYVGYGGSAEAFRDSESEGFSAGFDLRASLLGGNLLGASYYQQRSGVDQRRSERSFSVYSEIGLAPQLRLIGEHVLQLRDGTHGTQRKPEARLSYAALHWQFAPQYYLAYRFNWGDTDDRLGVTDARYAHTLTLGYQPTRSLRLKLEYADHAFRSSPRGDFRYWAASIGGLF